MSVPVDDGVDPIQQLPLELQLEIFAHLGYQGCLMLSQTSHHYLEATKLQDHPVSEKEAFIKEAQTWRKHNTTYESLNPIRPQEPHLHTLTNGFACYSCYRVRPFTAFPRKQVQIKYDKTDRKEAAPGTERCCIDCGIGKGLYRNRTRIAIIESMWWHYTESKPRCTSTVMIYCGTCKQLKKFHDTGVIWVCRDCNTGADTDRVAISFGDRGKQLYTCKQCDITELAEPVLNCCFCERPVCLECGGGHLPSSTFWCGRGCCKDMWAMMLEISEEERTTRFNLCNIAQEKRAVRSSEKEDVFDDCWEDQVNCFSLLSL